ncbi:hypothetical protein QBC43DRAFT_366723 [Cladorrhinum sp. PSN259]|nr:hypothetical protein QBC43DRAFT_366723 [Cladorrhinum sp. PSN259]
MLHQTITTALLLSLAALSSAAPTSTSSDDASKLPSRSQHAPRTTHTVVAGRGGLKFEPDNIVATPGSIVEFHFLPANHSVVESSFAKPCQPKDHSSFYSGFFPVPAGGSKKQSDEVFQIEVRDDGKPIWFYCAQNNGRHCQSGMTGVINQNFDKQEFSLKAHRENAKGVQETSGVQSYVQGGWRIPNPQPLAGV